MEVQAIGRRSEDRPREPTAPLLHADSEVELAADEHAIASAAEEIQAHTRAPLLALTDSVGRTILDRLYGGSVERWRSHGAKVVSLRRLAERLRDVRMSASGLCRCVAIHLALRDLGGREQLAHLTPSHVRAVLRIPAARRAELLREAEARRWTSRELEAHVHASQPAARRGRPRLPAFVHTLRRLARLVRARDAFAGLEKLPRLDRAEVEELLHNLLFVRERLEQIQPHISPVRAGWPAPTPSDRPAQPSSGGRPTGRRRPPQHVPGVDGRHPDHRVPRAADLLAGAARGMPSRETRR